MPIEWREEMAIDHGPIDEDHKALIAIINAFCQTAPVVGALPKLRSTLAKLHHYAAVHFRREEALQAKVQFPLTEDHHKEHMELGRRLTEVREQLAQISDPGNSDGRGARSRGSEISAVHARLEIFVHDWLVDHIIRSDLRMKPYTAKMAEHVREWRPLGELAP